MNGKKQKHQEKLEEEQKNARAASQDTTEHTSIEPSSRPRTIVDSERIVQRGREKNQQRGMREMMKSRGIGASVRPKSPFPGIIQHLEKMTPESRSAVVKETKPIGFIEDRETVKWAAYGALLVSFVTIFLLTIYSKRDFSPAFEYYDLKIMQDQLDSRVNKLEHTSQLEKIRNAVINAQFQLFVREDKKAAELLLIKAKEDLNTFIDFLSIEKTSEPKEVLNKIDRVLREIRREPSPLDEEFRSVVLGLEKL